MMALIITDFVKISPSENCIIARRKWLMWPFCLLFEICNYQAHSYLMLKSPNIDRITLVYKICFCCRFITCSFDKHFLISPKDFKQFLTWRSKRTHARNFCQNWLMLMHGVPERIFELTLIHATVIYEIAWIQWIFLPFMENYLIYQYKFI